MSARDPFALALLALAAVNLAAGLWVVRAKERVQTTYVFTPLVDVVPGATVLADQEALALREDLRTQVDARDMQSAYAMMGSTMSLDDFAEGLASLADSPHPLTPDQAARLRALLDEGRARHEALWRAQDDILQLEARLARDVAGVVEALPPEAREAALAATRRRPPAAPPRPR